MVRRHGVSSVQGYGIGMTVLEMLIAGYMCLNVLLTG